MDVVYDGIRLAPAEMVEAARSGVHCVGLSILSGSHIALTEEVLKLLRAAGLGRVPLIAGGIIPPADVGRLKAAGVAADYTPKDFEIDSVLRAIVQEVETRIDADPETADEELRARFRHRRGDAVPAHIAEPGRRSQATSLAGRDVGAPL